MLISIQRVRMCSINNVFNSLILTLWSDKQTFFHPTVLCLKSVLSVVSVVKSVI